MDVKGFLKSGANIRKYHFDPDSSDYEYNVNELSWYRKPAVAG